MSGDSSTAKSETVTETENTEILEKDILFVESFGDSS